MWHAAFDNWYRRCIPTVTNRSGQAHTMNENDIPDVFWDALRDLAFEGWEELDAAEWRPLLPEGLTDNLEVAGPSVTFGRMVHMVGNPASPSVAYTHVILHHGKLGMRVYYPGRPIPGSVGIPAYLVGFKDLPQVRRMYEVERVLARLRDRSDERSAYSQAVSVATVQQATRALAGLASFERLPFTLYPLHAA